MLQAMGCLERFLRKAAADHFRRYHHFTQAAALQSGPSFPCQEIVWIG